MLSLLTLSPYQALATLIFKRAVLSQSAKTSALLYEVIGKTVVPAGLKRAPLAPEKGLCYSKAIECFIHLLLGRESCHTLFSCSLSAVTDLVLIPLGNVSSIELFQSPL